MVIPPLERLLFEQQVFMRPTARFQNRNRLVYCLNDGFVLLEGMLSPVPVSIALRASTSPAVVTEEGIMESSTDTLTGLFDPPMLRKMDSNGRRGEGFGAK